MRWEGWLAPGEGRQGGTDELDASDEYGVGVDGEEVADGGWDIADGKVGVEFKSS